MTQWRFVVSRINTTVPQSGSRYVGLAGGTTPYSSTEADVQTKFYTAFTISQLRISVTTNAGTSTVAFRDDGVSSGNQVLSVTTTGWQEDVTGSDTPAANSLCGIIMTAGGSHANNITLDAALLTYEHASTTAPLVGFAHTNALSGTVYTGFGNGGPAADTTEANAKTRVKRATSVSNLRAYVTAAMNAGSAIDIRNDGVSSSNVALAPGTGTAAFEDTTGSEAITAEHDVNFRISATTGIVTICQASLDTQAAITGGHAPPAGATWSATTREFESFSGGSLGSTTADDNYTGRMGSVTAANFQCYISVAGSGTRDCGLRVASTNSTNLTTSPTGTGLFEDTTGSDSVADTNNVTWTFSAATTAMTVARVSVELPWFATSTDVTGTAAATFAKLAAAATATQTQTGTATATFPKLAASATATQTHTGTVAATFPKLAASATATQTHSGTGAATFARLTASATGTHPYTGTAAATFPRLTASATATQTHTGTAAATFAHLTASATGAMLPSGTGAATFPKLAASATATQTHTGTAAATFPALTASATGTQTHSGTVAATFAHLGASATGAMLPSGAAAATFPALTASATATQTQTGTAAATFAALTASATTTQTHTGTVAATFAHLTASATADHSAAAAPTGTVAATFPALTASATATQTQTGTVAATFNHLTASATGAMLPSGTAAATFAALTASATATQTQTGTAAAAFKALTASATAAQTHSGAASATFASLVASATTVMLPSGTGAATFPALVGAAAVTQTQTGTAAATFPVLVAAGTLVQTAPFSATVAATFPVLVAAGNIKAIPAANVGPVVGSPVGGVAYESPDWMQAPRYNPQRWKVPRYKPPW